MSTATLARPAVISEHDDYAADLAADLAAAALAMREQLAAAAAIIAALRADLHRAGIDATGAPWQASPRPLAVAAPARTVIVSGCVACAAEQGPHDCAAYTVPLAQRSVIAAPTTIGGAL